MLILQKLWKALGAEKTNQLTLINYFLKSLQGILIFLIIDYNLTEIDLNQSYRIFYFIGLASVFDLGIPSILHRNIIRQVQKKEISEIGYGTIILFIFFLIGMIIVTPIYFKEFVDIRFLIYIGLIVFLRKIWSLINAITFGFQKIFDFRAHEFFLQLMRISFPLLLLLKFKNLDVIFISEILSFLVIINLMITKKKLLNKVSFKLEKSEYLISQVRESWRVGILNLSGYLSSNLFYLFDLSHINFNDQNNFFFNIKVFQSIKTFAQIPTLNIQPYFSKLINQRVKISKMLIFKTLLFNLSILIFGYITYFLLVFCEIKFINQYYLNLEISVFIALVFLIDLFQATIGNIVISSGKIPFWITSLISLIIQIYLYMSLELSLFTLVLILLIRPLVSIFQCLYEGLFFYKKFVSI